jgi:transcriptional regulator with XRE-family HTH domain
MAAGLSARGGAFLPSNSDEQRASSEAAIHSTLVRERHGLGGRNISNYKCLWFYLHFCMHDCLSEFWQWPTVPVEIFQWVPDRNPSRCRLALPSRRHRLRASLGLTRKSFSRLTGYSERAIAEWEAGKEQSDSSRQRLTEIHRLRQSLVEVIPEEQIGIWLMEPNEALDGFKPLEVIERGEIDRIWWLIHAAATTSY